MSTTAGADASAGRGDGSAGLRSPAPVPALVPRSAPPWARLDLALGWSQVDRRGLLRSHGWPALPTPARAFLLDERGELAVQLGDDGSVTLAVVDLPPPTESALFLGVDAAGVSVCALVVAHDDPLVPRTASWAGMRGVGARLDPSEWGMVGEALALVNWHRTHAHCPRCGALSESAGLGWWRVCPADGTQHFPRTDPAIIAVVVDEAGNALLGRQARWPSGAFSTLAGFVEAGESAEAAVEREIGEEVGLAVTQIDYVASQPWPFPSSLMLGFSVRVDGVRPHFDVDGQEIAEARWISRSELPVLGDAREVRLPGHQSIAHHLIRGWYGEPIPSAWCRW